MPIKKIQIATSKMVNIVESECGALECVWT